MTYRKYIFILQYYLELLRRYKVSLTLYLPTIPLSKLNPIYMEGIDYFITLFSQNSL